MSDRAVMMTTATKAGQKVGQEPVEKEEQDGDQACTDQASQLGPGSRLVNHGCAATADGDGEPLEESSSDI